MPSPSFPPASSIDVSPLALGHYRQEMAVWAEPVIADRIAHAYRDRGLTATRISLLAIHHRRLWRAVILDQRAAAERIWVELERDLQRLGLASDVTEEVDAVVLDELMDIVMTRYRGSRDKAKGFGRVLLSAAAQTGTLRPLPA